MRYNSEFLKEDGSLNYSIYAEYFADNIQYAEKYKDEIVFEGLSYDEFLISWNKDIVTNISKIEKFLGINKRNRSEEKRLKELNEFQEKLSHIGINIDFANLFFLCYFIMRVIKTGYLALLKPTPKETLEMIKDITKVTFNNADGDIVGTSYRDILNPIKEALCQITDVDDSTYEVEKLVKIDEISNEEIFQAKFVYYLSRFLKEYFPEATRRRNSYIITIEQELVMYMLTYFGMGNLGISLNRYRQLFMYAKNIKERFNYSLIEGYGILPITFVKYENWKGKRLSFIKKSKIPYKSKLYVPKIGETIVFTKDSIVQK